MSIAEKLTAIAENEPKVYDAGKRAEWSEFWDSAQEYGDRYAYAYAFAGSCWNDRTYNPKYPIIATGNAAYTFAYTGITDTKVDIDVSGSGSNKSSTFLGASKLVTIRKLITSEAVALNFNSCSKLENITFEGVIGRTQNFQWSPLSVGTMKNIISCLANYAGTESEYAYTLTFSSARWSALEADSAAPNGGTWKEYVKSLGWNAV